MSHFSVVRRLVPLTLLLSGALAVPAFAADTVQVANGTLTYSQTNTPAGEVNALTFAYSTTAITVTDGTAGNTITPVAPCTSVPVGAPSNQVSCPINMAETITAVSADLGDGNDSTAFTGWTTGAPTTIGITGDAGNDTIRTPSTLDTTDTIDGGDGNDVITTNGGPDVITPGAGDDNVDAGAGNDMIFNGPGSDRVVGGADEDTISYASSTAPVSVSPDDTRSGDDGENCGGLGTGVCEGDDIAGDVEDIIGGSGNDVLTGTSANNMIQGGLGDDTITGGDGDDKLFGDVSGATTGGNDTISGGNGIDVIDGGAGNDTIDGGAGNDTITGNTGNDVMTPGTGTNTVTGAAGADTVSFADHTSATTGVTVNLNTTTAQTVTPGESDTIATVESVTGSAGPDTLTGFTGAASTLNGLAGDDTLEDDGESDPAATTVFADTFIGGPGTDTVSYAGRKAAPAGSTAAVAATYNLSLSDDGVANDGYSGGSEADNIMPDVENITGGDANDTITGNGAANVLNGGPGNDTVNGGLGNDTLIGGDGTDTVSYADRTTPVTVSLASTAAQTVAGTEQDTLSQLENLAGGSASDTLTGDANANTITGNAGDDTIFGGAGADAISGGAGNDTLNGEAGNDTITGDADNDTINGGDDNDNLNGGAGNDLLDGGNGADVITGGADIDTTTYASHPASDPVTVTLDTAANDGGTADGNADNVDTENVIGGAGNDTITGDGTMNFLSGGPGNDTLDGSTNDDTLDGGTGNDTLIGGAGTDTVSYANRTENVTLDLSQALPAAAIAATPAETDQVRTVENVTGGSGNDVLTGSTVANVIDGGAGDDTIDGNTGADTLTGGTGTDRVSYAQRTVPVKVDLTDTTADQGASGENDKLTGFENVTTGSGADTIIGSASANDIVSGAGADTITTRDSPPQKDTVDCGGDADTLTADALDVPTNCESVDPGTPLPTLSINDQTVTEGDTGTKMAVFTVTLSAARPYPVSVSYATADGTATAGTDYVAASGTLTFPANTTTLTQTIPVTVNGDTTPEGDETFTVNLSNVTNATLADNSGLGTITDDDTPTVTVQDAPPVSEGNSGTTPAKFTVHLSKASPVNTTVTFRTIDGTATSPSDYQSVNTTVTVPAGQTDLTVDVLINGDTAVEPNETFTATISNPVNATLGAATSATGTILNDDSPVATVGDAASVTEGDSGTVNASFPVSLDRASNSTVTVTVSTQDGTATAPADYIAQSGTVVSFAPGETIHTVNVAVKGDTVVEPDEAFTLKATAASNATVGSPSAGTATIHDDDSPVATITAPPATNEGDTGTTPFTFTVHLDQPAAKTVSVDYATSDGTATASSDYAATSGTLTFAPGDQDKTFTVDVDGDTTPEPNETFTATLSNPSGLTLGTPAHADATIANDDAAPTVSITQVPSVPEGDSGTTDADFTLTLSQPSTAGDVTVNYSTVNGTATAGTDYTAAPSGAHVTFGTGETSKTVSVPISGDTAVEPDETFTLHLDSAAGATLGSPSVGTGTILNDDKPTVSISDAPAVTEGDSGKTPATFTVSLDQPGNTAVSVHVSTADGTATAGSDYDARTDVLLSIPAGRTSATFPVNVDGDTTVESDETFTTTISQPSGATLGAKTTGTATITDDDGPTVGFAPIAVSVPEGDTGTSTATLTVKLDQGDPSHATTVHLATADGTAKAGSDYVAIADQTVTFPAGTTTETVPVTVKGDTTVEDDETFTAALSAPSGRTHLGARTARVTIANDDTPTLSIGPGPSASEGDSGTKPFTFTATLSQPQPTQDVTAKVSTADGSATAGSDYAALSAVTVTIPHGQSTATFAVNVDGDTTVEPDETFTATLSAPTHATLGTPVTATATILNDDSPTMTTTTPTTDTTPPTQTTPPPAVVPSVSVNDIRGAEGNSGTSPFTFSISLSEPTTVPVSVTAVTGDSTAVAGSDYTALTQTVTFAPGETLKTLVVSVLGDTVVEPDETFGLGLIDPSGVDIAKSVGVATIVNDDAAPAPSGKAKAKLSLSVGSGRDKTAPYKYTLKGTLKSATGQKLSCSGAKVTLRLYRQHTTLLKKTVTVSSACTYSTKATLATTSKAGGKGRISVSAKLATSTHLAATNAKGKTVRVG